MAREFRCPACGDDDEIRGRETGAGIMLSCDACGHEWPRDETPRCATCGGTELSLVARAVVAGGRAAVQSIVGRQLVPVCARCDLDAVRTYTDRGHALPPGHI